MNGSDFEVTVAAPLDAAALEAATRSAREAAVLELYRLGRITSGCGARWLAIGRGEFLDLAAARGVPTIQVTPDELRREVESWRR
ncbi:MAG: UPF0175 family protein [Deltaproteobacteria bacterium]|nr:UPF0175 family protein [Deltaproteobacteria bacterium]